MSELVYPFRKPAGVQLNIELERLTTFQVVADSMDIDLTAQEAVDNYGKPVDGLIGINIHKCGVLSEFWRRAKAMESAA